MTMRYSVLSLVLSALWLSATVLAASVPLLLTAQLDVGGDVNGGNHGHGSNGHKDNGHNDDKANSTQLVRRKDKVEIIEDYVGTDSKIAPYRKPHKTTQNHVWVRCRYQHNIYGINNHLKYRIFVAKNTLPGMPKLCAHMIYGLRELCIDDEGERLGDRVRFHACDTDSFDDVSGMMGTTMDTDLWAWDRQHYMDNDNCRCVATLLQTLVDGLEMRWIGHEGCEKIRSRDYELKEGKSYDPLLEHKNKEEDKEEGSAPKTPDIFGLGRPEELDDETKIPRPAEYWEPGTH